MPHRNNQLRLSNLNGYLSQINDNSSPDTIIKLNCRAANCLFRAGNLKNINKAIRLYTEAYDVQSNFRGSSHSRTFHILNLIIKCENSMINLKNIRMEMRRNSKLSEEALRKKKQGSKDKLEKKKMAKMTKKMAKN